MMPLSDLLLGLVEDLPRGAGATEDPVRVELDALSVSLPIEARLGRELLVTPPARRTTTGFDRPVHQLSIRFEREEG